MRTFNYTPSSPFSGKLTNLGISLVMIVFPLVAPFGIRIGSMRILGPTAVTILFVAGGAVLLLCTLLEIRKARALAAALKKLQQIDCTGGPAGGAHNFYRGCSPAVYDAETRAALDKLRERLPVDLLAAVWERCIAEPYTGGAVWVHGDVAPGNILLRERRFCGLIDFGILGTGDPACDYAMAWTYFSPAERDVFLRGLDCGAVARARGWALWKALITYDDSDADFRENARHTVREILKECG